MAVPDGFRLWSSYLGPEEQTELAARIAEHLTVAPFYQSVTPGGRPLSVRMTSFGSVGWVSDQQGYRYEPRHPVTGQAWPPIPYALIAVWRRLSNWPADPDTCLVNLYDAGARMGLHQDRDEADLTAPVLSVSLGDTAVFRIGPLGGGRTSTVRLASGDVCILAGEARMARHGIDRILAGSSRLLPDGGRINLTLRCAA